MKNLHLNWVRARVGLRPPGSIKDLLLNFCVMCVYLRTEAPIILPLFHSPSGTSDRKYS